MRTALILMSLLTSNSYASNIETYTYGYSEGSSQSDYFMEIAEADMYKNALEKCDKKFPVRTSDITYADVGYMSVVSATFICINQ
jgi:hypothetical protein